MKYITITSPDINNGIGCRATLWISGCNHACRGCHNNMYWEYNIGKDFDIDSVIERLSVELDKPYIQGFTLSGGDPLAQTDEDLEIELEFLKKIKLKYPDKDIWLYSGDVYEDAIKHPIKKAIIRMCDIMVDGPFIIELMDHSLAFRGSSNQRILKISEMTNL